MNSNEKIQKLEQKSTQLKQQIESLKQKQQEILEELLEEEGRKTGSETDPDYYDGYDPYKIADLKDDWQKLEYKIEDLTNAKDEINAEIYYLKNPEIPEKIECSSCGREVNEDE